MDKFIEFATKLKNNKNAQLIESIVAGYNIIFEGLPVRDLGFVNQEPVIPLASFVNSGKSKELSVEDIAANHDVPVKDIEDQLDIGIPLETKEHTDNKTDTDTQIGEKIAMDHEAEIPDYYTRLTEMERQAGETEEK